MASSQPEVAADIIAFSSYLHRRIQNLTGCLTPKDRLDLSNWRVAAGLAGFDRMIIHDREEDDASEVGNFLSVYRRGEAWSRWGFARRGAKIRAWCSVSWVDKGEYDTLAQAFEDVLGVVGPISAATDITVLASTEQRSAVITDLLPRLHACSANRFGSAA